MADLTTTITETVTINGTNRGSTNTLTITGIEHTFERVVTIPADADGTVLLTKDTITSSDGAVDIQDTKYIRITNLDDTNSVNLSLQIDRHNDDSGAENPYLIYNNLSNMLRLDKQPIHHMWTRAMDDEEILDEVNEWVKRAMDNECNAFVINTQSTNQPLPNVVINYFKDRYDNVISEDITSRVNGLSRKGFEEYYVMVRR